MVTEADTAGSMHWRRTSSPSGAGLWRVCKQAGGGRLIKFSPAHMTGFIAVCS